MRFSRRQFSAGALALTGAGLIGARSLADAGEPVVETAYGKVRGVAQEGGAFAFKGVPYGASTAGANRFMPPVAPEPWTGVRDCVDWGSIAPQGASRANPSGGMGDDFARFFGVGSELALTQSEDCLGLNVFTPALDGGRRPVMVWMHGGGFSIGGSSGARADGSNLARQHDVVTVSVNHRLGALGYCHLGEFDSDFVHSGNVGQLDLIAALEWVRDNIEAFGGDPNTVMIHGESGGGGKVSTLMAMPGASGLFERAICQSGTANTLPTTDKAAEHAERLLNALEVPKGDIRALQNVAVEQLIEAASQIERAAASGPRSGFVPTSGTVDLPKNPIEAVSEGSAQVPFMIGCTKHEASLFLSASGTDPREVTEELLQARVGAMFGDKSDELLAGYRENHPDHTASDLLVRIMSDRTRMASIALAEAHIQGGGAPTYMYLFTWESPVLPHLKSAHGIDGTFYFDTTESVEIASDNPEAKQLATNASTAWTHFARNGTPQAGGLPNWPEYTTEERETMVLSTSPHVESDPMSADRLMRERLGV